MQEENQIRDYITYPRCFAGWKWWKPLRTGLLVSVFYGLIIIVLYIAVFIIDKVNHQEVSTLAMAQGGYDSFNSYSLAGVLLNLGSLAAFIPAFWLASLVSGERPFSSYSSARGGWDWKLFFFMLIPAFVTCGIPAVIYAFAADDYDGPVRFTVPGFIILLLIGPAQCIAEEYFFRGYLLQTVGSWCRKPVVAIIVQMILFGLMHPYNIFGVIEVCVFALLMAVITHITKGLEAASTAHVANNVTFFILTGFGVGSIKSEVTVTEVIISVVSRLAFLLVVLYGKKKGWFDRVLKDDVTEYSNQLAAKEAAKAKA